MILKWLIDAVVSVLTGLLSLVPDWALPTTWTSTAASGVGTMVAWGNGYFPFKHLLIAVVVFVGARLALGGWTVVVWLYDKLPLKAT